MRLVALLATMQVIEFWNTVGAKQSQPLMNWGCLQCLVLLSKPTHYVLWHSPLGCLKINFDGLLLCTGGSGGASFVARDHLGWLLSVRTWVTGEKTE